MVPNGRENGTFIPAQSLKEIFVWKKLNQTQTKTPQLLFLYRQSTRTSFICWVWYSFRKNRTLNPQTMWENKFPSLWPVKITITWTSAGPEELTKVVTNDFHVFWNFTYSCIRSFGPSLARMLFYFQQVELIQTFLAKSNKTWVNITCGVGKTWKNHAAYWNTELANPAPACKPLI